MFWAALESLATVAAAVVAIATLLALRADSRQRTRPVVTADLQRPPTVGENIGFDLVVRNSGATAARDVKVSFDPEPLIIDEDETAKHPRERRVAEWLVNYFSEPITSLPPGRGVRANYYWAEDDPEDPTKRRNKHPLPGRFIVKISYRPLEQSWIREWFKRPKIYAHRFPLVVRDFDDSFMEWTPTNHIRGIHRAIDNVVRKLDTMG